jgi:hypothetical protein
MHDSASLQRGTCRENERGARHAALALESGPTRPHRAGGHARAGEVIGRWRVTNNRRPQPLV